MADKYVVDVLDSETLRSLQGKNPVHLGRFLTARHLSSSFLVAVEINLISALNASNVDELVAVLDNAVSSIEDFLVLEQVKPVKARVDAFQAGEDSSFCDLFVWW